MLCLQDGRVEDSDRNTRPNLGRDQSGYMVVSGGLHRYPHRITPTSAQGIRPLIPTNIAFDHAKLAENTRLWVWPLEQHSHGHVSG